MKYLNDIFFFNYTILYKSIGTKAFFVGKQDTERCCILSKVRILLVAPYEGMRDVVRSVAAARDDIEVTTLVGNMERGADLVRKCDQELYDVILSRGGTADYIREVANIPVIEIELTPYDIRNVLAAVSGRKQKFVVAGFPSIAEAARSLCDIMDIDGIDIVTIRNDTVARATLPKLKAQGVELLLCDMVGVEAAPAVGLETVLITSGVKGIEDALNKAVSYFSSFGWAKLAAGIQNAELAAAGQSMVVISASGKTVFSAPGSSVQPAVRKLLCRMIPSVFSDGYCLVSRPIGSRDYAIIGTPIHFDGEQCVAFRLQREGFTLPVKTPGVTFYNSGRKDILHISRHYGGRNKTFIDRAEKIAQSGLPVAVYGERGTLVTAMASYIGMYGLLSQRDCCEIDCSKVGSKGWQKLMGQSGLLGFRPGTTIIFEKLLDMPAAAVETLIDFIWASDLTSQLRIVFAINKGVHRQREQDIIRLITDWLYGVVFRLPPLRERKQELPELLDNCFTYSCADMGIQKPAMEEEARKLLLHYAWPRNYPQMHRVVCQLLSDGSEEPITGAQVQELLRVEGPSDISEGKETQINISGTMEDINYRIVQQVLAEEGMNRTLTAKRLGISRATLWRILNRGDETEYPLQQQ